MTQPNVKTVAPSRARRRNVPETESSLITTSGDEPSKSSSSKNSLGGNSGIEGVMGADEVLARLSAQARGSLAPFLVEKDGGWFPDLSTPEAQAHLFLLKKAKFKQRILGGSSNPVAEIEVELELHDPQAALRDLGRHHKLFTDRAESVGVEVLKVEVEYVNPP